MPFTVENSGGLSAFSVLEYNPSMMTVKDERSRYVFANRKARSMLKLEGKNFRALYDADIFDEEGASRAVAHDLKAFETQQSVEYRADLTLLDGTVIYAHVVKSVTANANGHFCVVTAIYNLDELADARQLTVDAERRFEMLVESAPYGILLYQNGRVVYANNESVALLKFNTASELIGKHYREMLTESFQTSHDQRNAETLRRIDDTAYFLDQEFIRSDGSHLEAEVFKRLIPYEGGNAVLVHIRDVSERRRNERKLLELANTDELTGLPNRHQIQTEAQFVLESSQTTNQQAALVFIDLDQFKRVNDSFGHTVGDELIRLVAKRLSSVVRPRDSIGRLGGDEFVVLIGATDREKCQTIAARILDQLRAPFHIGGIEIYSGASLGIAMYPDAGSNVVDLVKAADTAMYQAKADGRNTFRFFEPEMRERAQNNAWLDTNLRQALESSQFELYYQPKMCATTSNIRGLEALIRWNHPVKGLISPLEFIPFAEESGIIVQMGDWVIHAACAQIAEWAKIGIHVPVAVNVSARQLMQHGLADTIRLAVAAAGIPPAMLEIELTESALVQDEALALTVLTSLQEFGCSLYLDDFGTGYSSLSQLSKFSMDAVKVDKSFVSSMATDPKAKALVEAMVYIARALGMHLVAEGVETTEQFEMLREMGCDVVQGYLFAKPMPALQTKAFLCARLAKASTTLGGSAVGCLTSAASRLGREKVV